MELKYCKERIFSFCDLAAQNHEFKSKRATTTWLNLVFVFMWNFPGAYLSLKLYMTGDCHFSSYLWATSKTSNLTDQQKLTSEFVFYKQLWQFSCGKSCKQVSKMPWLFPESNMIASLCHCFGHALQIEILSGTC